MTLPFSDSFLSASRQHAALFSSPIQSTLSNGTQVTITAPGIISFEPAKSLGKSIVYSCGVHGNETAPIEICDELVTAILNEDIQIQHRLLILFGNLAAMDTATRFIEENMNRLFCNEHANPTVPTNPERQRAALLEQSVSTFFETAAPSDTRYHYDLHTAIRASKNEKFAVYPFLHGKKHNKAQLAFLADCGVKTILLSQSPTTTFSYYSSVTHGAHAFTVELGKVKPFGQNDMSRFAAAKRALFDLLTQEDYQPQSDLSDTLLYTVNQVINKHHQDFALHFDDDTPNFTDYPKGTVLASETGAEYIAEVDGEAIVFPNADVAIGQRALLTVIPTTIPE
ncbi:succinylglutamate desuccinylase [Alteromonas sediminis]|uniref:Succinylglutamate desuccinylase n=1 Tax=Alteromonas sediminis TaxID=2259342 RepID=A0A3N5Y1U1_9ALTE|nr:succinylglutamate desuccinylase [Alteromonas sediminis]RPJ67200.1 succinylglutamate desuccinylase [Alteromonas sediminis]